MSKPKWHTDEQCHMFEPQILIIMDVMKRVTGWEISAVTDGGTFEVFEMTEAQIESASALLGVQIHSDQIIVSAAAEMARKTDDL